MFYKYFIQLCILTFETILLFSFNKKIEFRRNFIKEFRCFTKLEHFSPSFGSAYQWGIGQFDLWPMGNRKKQMQTVGFWWWSDMQTVPPKMLLEIYTTNVYTLQILNIFFFKFAQLLFSESNRFLWLIYCIDG